MLKTYITDCSLVIVAVIWALNFSVIKITLEEIDPFSFNVLRNSLASFTLVFVAKWKRKKILVKKDELTLEGITQYYMGVEQESWKLATLHDLYEKLSIAQSIIFTNSRRKAEYIKEQLLDKNFTADCIHGEMQQKNALHVPTTTTYYLMTLAKNPVTF